MYDYKILIFKIEIKIFLKEHKSNWAIFKENWGKY